MTKLAAFAFAVMVAAACDKGDKGGAAGGGAAAGGGGAAAPIALQDGADGLKALFTASHAACSGKDFGKGKALVMSLIPTATELKKVFKDDVGADVLDGILSQYKQVPAEEDKVACLLSPEGRTEITVHASTVEDLAAYKEGSPAYNEFPGGARKLAETALKPGTTFYEVEVTEPGKDSGTKFHMFFWDGKQWRMLGAAWRALKG